MQEWKILIVVFPAVAAVIGWVTNVVALKMLFKPYEPVRLLFFNFQGVLPKHFEEYANKIADIGVADFLTTQELASMLEPQELAEDLKEYFDRAFDEAIEEAKKLADPKFVSMLEPPMTDEIRKQIWTKVIETAPSAVEQLVERAEELVNLHDLIVEKNMLLGPQNMEKILWEIGGKELKWIEYFGGIFGVIIGFFQFGLVNLFPQAEAGQTGLAIKLAMPLFGCLVGLVTNWFAVQMLWNPREPRGWWIFKYQGLFPKRQAEIQAGVATVSARELVLPSEIFGRISDYMTPEAIETAMLERWETNLAEAPPNLKGLLDTLLPGKKQEQFVRAFSSIIVKLLPEMKQAFVDFTDRKLDIFEILMEKGDMLTKADFEGYIRDIMEKEEVYLIVYGGVLGGIMGTAQLGIYLTTMAYKYAQTHGLTTWFF